MRARYLNQRRRAIIFRSGGVVRFGPPLRRSRSSPAVSIVLVEQGKKIVLPDNDVRRDVIQRRNLMAFPVALGDALP